MPTPNLDPDEVAQFAVQAGTWWDENGPARALHDLNPVRLAFIARHCPLRGRRVLDVGCGGGLLSEALASAGASVTAIDAAEPMIGVARLHARAGNLAVDYQCCTLEQYAAGAPAPFDLITCMELLEHVPDPAALLATAAGLLAPGGVLAVSTINRTPQAYALAILGAEYALGLLPRGTHDYARFIRPAELAAWLRAAGLELLALEGMRWSPLTRRAGISSSLAVNYLAAARRGL